MAASTTDVLKASIAIAALFFKEILLGCTDRASSDLALEQTFTFLDQREPQ